MPDHFSVILIAGFLMGCPAEQAETLLQERVEQRKSSI
jgi:hypothetical protein